ncbi:hypothetical protein [Streptomyces odonnellii]|uniref:hypothetical protein n=1 Tax=Streptomyces odonnellii TaxID=1417980 RepID=UPI0006264AC9|nr:hypothetical protein [Streptomyces odonnellii]
MLFRQLTIPDGWRTFAAGPPEPPVLLSSDELRRLSPAERALYDEDQLDRHARMLVVAASSVEKTVYGRAEFTRFLGLPVRPQPNMTDIIRPWSASARTPAPARVLVVEIHKVRRSLGPATRSSRP